MQRPQGISAHEGDAPGEPDVGLRLSAALKRLAALRATIHGDWSDGPASLLDVANVDLSDGETLCWTEVATPRPIGPDLNFAPAHEPPVAAWVVETPMPLRGRFADPADAIPAVAAPIDVSWLDLVDDDDAQPAASTLAPAPGEMVVALAFAEDREAVAAPLVVGVATPEPIETNIIEIDYIEPAFAIGATSGILELVQGAVADVAAPIVPEAAALLSFEDDDLLPAIGATAGLGTLLSVIALDPPAQAALLSLTAIEIDDVDPLPLLAFGAAPGLLAAPPIDDLSSALAPEISPAIDDELPVDVPCAPFDLHALLALSAPIAAEAPAAPAPTRPEDDTPPALAVGAFALCFVGAPEAAPAEVITVAIAWEGVGVEVDLAFGAAPMLAALLDSVPALNDTPPVVRAFDPVSVIDDALADAFDTLLCARDPIDPFDAAWTPETFADTDHTAQLAACEAGLWALPRHVPCIETFLLTPSHETAVRITRALRLRANALEARAFAETAGFGFLSSDTDAQAFWFLADALHDASSLSAGDADVGASFADWRMNDDGLLVVTAPDNAHPKRPPPLISEAELDALFAHVDDSQSRVVLDDLGDDPTWNDTFWCDVDTYLEHVSETMDPAVIDYMEAQTDQFDIHDIEVRAAPIVVAPPTTTFFWIPGDDYDLAIDGVGDDLFIVGANETPAVILVEDGSTYSMRTGQIARMDEVVVSLSFDAWRYVDAMQWRRVATLSGVAHVRVEQNATGTRQAVLAGAFFATTLEDDGVRLVRSGDDGDVDHPVMRLGGPSLDADWPFADIKTDGGAYVVD